MKTCSKKIRQNYRNMQQTCSFCLISMTTASTISWRILVVDLGIATLGLRERSSFSIATILLRERSSVFMFQNVPRCCLIFCEVSMGLYIEMDRNEGAFRTGGVSCSESNQTLSQVFRASVPHKPALRTQRECWEQLQEPEGTSDFRSMGTGMSRQGVVTKSILHRLFLCVFSIFELYS